MLKAHLRIILEISNKLLLIQQATISIIQLARQIPVEERDKRDDVFSKEVVDEFLVEGDPGWVDGVVATAERNDPGPGDGEAVGFRTSLFEKCDVFGGAIVGIAGYGSR